MIEQTYLQIINCFNIPDRVVDVKPFGDGLINDTFKIVTEGGGHDYILQKINVSIFKDVSLLQSNIQKVTSHLERKYKEAGCEDVSRHVLKFIPAKDGNTWVEHEGGFWRMMVFISDSFTCNEVNEESARKVGEAIGNFHTLLADIPYELQETIPHFHDMEFRLQEFRQAVADDKASRAGSVRAEIDEILSRAEEMTIAERLGREGRLPKRVCHCDTKVNNLLLDAEGNVLAVIDLDTVMPNFIFSDYGDFLRTAANEVAEDCPDLDKVAFRPDIFKAFTRGYMSSAAFITDTEAEMLPFAVRLFPYMQCVRFLGDYLNGDTYYKTSYPEHNLVRARNQLALLHSIEDYDSQGEMSLFVGSLRRR